MWQSGSYWTCMVAGLAVFSFSIFIASFCLAFFIAMTASLLPCFCIKH